MEVTCWAVGGGEQGGPPLDPRWEKLFLWLRPKCTGLSRSGGLSGPRHSRCRPFGPGRSRPRPHCPGRRSCCPLSWTTAQAQRDCARGDSWYASRRGRAGPAHPRSQLSSPLQSRTVPRALAGRGLAPEREGPRSGRGPETLPVGRSTPTPMATPGPRRGFWPWFPEVLTRPSGAQPSSGCRRGASLSPHGSSGQRGSVGPRAPRAAGTSPQCLGGLAGDSLC